MLQSLTHYATALIFLAASAVIYQNVITPWMQPPQMEAVPLSKTEVMRTNDESLKDLFPDDSWQRGLCKQLQTSDGMMLFQNLKQIDNDQWKLWPVTVVIGRGMSGEKNGAPVIIEAPQGAQIKFTESLDVMSGGAPPIHRGSMLGDVQIYRTQEDGTRSLDLRTANVGIDNRKIWTTETVEMKVGQARMVGRDLTIHLAGAAGSGDTASPAVLDRMELIYLDEFVMPLEKGGLWEQNSASPNPPSRSLVLDQTQTPAITPANTPAMISVQCGGRVEYDFAIDQLYLNDSVSLVHQTPGVLADRFDCESLELQLNDPTNDSIERRGPMDWLIDIVATGSPAVAKLPTFDAELAAERIEFNAISGLVRADGDRGVQARRGGITARLASLRYQFDPQQPKAVGTIDVPGAGIVFVDDPSIPLRKVQWADYFQLEPKGVAMADNLDTEVALRVEGDVHAWLTDGGEFQAGSIKGILKPDEQADSDSSVTLVPDRFLITGDVRIDTTAVAAETERLWLFFVAEDDPRPKTVAGDQPPGNSPFRQWVAQPQQPGGMVDPIARLCPVIRGDTVTAELRRNESGLSAKNLSVTGAVKIEHHLTAGGQTLPAVLTGTKLTLEDGGGEDILQLDGGAESPARFELGDGFFVGPQIQIRPSDNYLWINDAGEFQMPTAALPTGLAGDSNGKVQWTQPPHCWWQGQMVFDGRTAVLSEGVDIKAAFLNGREPWELHMTGDRLQVDLLEDVQVRDMQAMRGATIEKISLMQADNRPVVVQALRRAADGVLEAKHLIYAAKLSLVPAGGGRIIGAGPGWYRGWMIPQSGHPMLGSKDATPVDRESGELTGVHLIFNDSMQADMTGKYLDFLRGVRVGVKTVSDWEHAFDARKMDAISMGESTIDCDRLRFNVEPGYDSSRRVAGANTPWEMEATGGVVYRTRSDRGLLEGTASRAAYSSSKDLFKVDGAPNRPAIFRQTNPDGSKGPEGAVRTMSIRPDTMKVEEFVFERFNIATPPGNSQR